MDRVAHVMKPLSTCLLRQVSDDFSYEKTLIGVSLDRYELCSNFVFIILYILLDEEASINANHS